MARFVFVVHALTRLSRWAMGVRGGRPALALDLTDGTSAFDVLPIASLGLPGVCEGLVVGVPMLPDDLLADQERALRRMERAVALAGPVEAVGLGSLCAVVAGRGQGLAERVSPPVTTGGAATAWALLENTRVVHRMVGGPVAVVGASGPVGRVVSALLAEEGVPVRVDSPRGARGLPVTGCDSAEDAVRGCRLVVGAGPTGASLDAAALQPGAVVVDVAIPGTVRGRAPVTVLAGEAVSLPAGWHRGGWGWLYHALAGYGPWQAFACLIEPLALAVSGRGRPYALGRKIDPQAVLELGQDAVSLGFHPRLSRGWRGVSAPRLARRLGGALLGTDEGPPAAG